MLSREELIEHINKRQPMRITAQYDAVSVAGIADCDGLNGGRGCALVRAKFKHSIKAILPLDEYGKTWKAETP